FIVVVMSLLVGVFIWCFVVFFFFSGKDRKRIHALFRWPRSFFKGQGLNRPTIKKDGRSV
ncbi:hypothetical protein, partial [Enterococcus faecalis]|uniref:hypothetical protein n=1 Tax=Enterococcus faecalis TaxID=1351 RepID=UPI001C400CE7